jgi:hypothetical protein
MAEFVFGEKDNGAFVQVPLSSKIVIKLSENPALSQIQLAIVRKKALTLPLP